MAEGVPAADLVALDREVEAEVRAAAARALEAPDPAMTTRAITPVSSEVIARASAPAPEPEGPPRTMLEAMRDVLRDRLAAPSWGWGTYHGPSMATHVLLPCGLAVQATLGRATSGALLGNIFVFRQANPAIVNVVGHGYDGSNYTELQVGAWSGAACTTTLATTIGAGGGLQLLASTNIYYCYYH
jgi:hypothetical protein